MRGSTRRGGRRLGVVLVCATGAFALMGGVAIATIPDGSGVIYSCFNQAVGTWRPINFPTTNCKPNEQQLSAYSKTGADAAFIHTGGAAGGALTGTFPNPGLADGSVGTAQLQDGAVTNTKIGPKAVDTPQLQLQAVDTAQLKDGAVTNTKIGAKAVDTPQLQLQAVDTAQLKDGAVDTLQLKDNAVKTAKIADNQVTNGKLANSSLSVNAGPGLANQPGGGSVSLGGSTTLSLAGSYQLPQNCSTGQVPASNGSGSWGCADQGTPAVQKVQGTGGGTTTAPFGAYAYASDSATCPSGSNLVGGGYSMSGDLVGPVVTNDAPDPTNGNTWDVQLRDTVFNSDTVTAYAICIG